MKATHLERHKVIGSWSGSYSYSSGYSLSVSRCLLNGMLKKWAMSWSNNGRSRSWSRCRWVAR
jgi:hypothetical protein